MSTQLETNLRLMLKEKEEKIIPRNIRKGVNIFGVEVGSDYNLKAFTPNSPRRFNANLVSLCRSNLTLCKTLISVISNILAAFTKMLFNRHHISVSGELWAIHTRNIGTLIGLIRVGCVINSRSKVGCLFGIFGVINNIL